ncbi:MAG: putative lipopolysaccharide heptosyltransferase III [Nitrospirae bacterium]|nr:putative lipopolysaccharide heptosyltransferase III [Nitrospirota bacterium]
MAGNGAPRRILIVKLRYLGDVVLLSPVVRALREAYPAAEIGALVNAGTEAMLDGNPNVDRIFIRGRSWRGQLRLVHDLRAFRPDLAIDLTDGDRAALLTRLSGAPRRLGFNDEGRWRGRLYTEVVRADSKHLHAIDYHLAPLAHLGLSVAARPPELFLREEEDRAATDWLATVGVRPARPFVVIHPGARFWFKQWPLDRVAALADRIQEIEGYPVVVLGGTKERPDLASIHDAMRTPFRTTEGRVSVRIVAAIIRRARLFIGNDNGPMHIATAVGTPVVALFGSSDPRVWGPWGEGHRVIYKQVPCSPCAHTGCDQGPQNCMRLISIEEVSAVVSESLRRAPVPGAATASRA